MSFNPIKGKESLFYIKKNDEYFPVGCLTSSPFSEDVEMLGTTTRENDGWKTALPTNQSYSINLSGLMVQDDEDSGNEVLSYRQLRIMKRNRELIEWRRVTLDGYYIDSGKAYIINISDSDEADGFITFQATLQGYGMPIEEEGIRRALGIIDIEEVLITNNEKAIINGYSN